MTFPLCRTCMETEQPKSLTERSCVCDHTNEQRQLTGTWCTPELKEAIRQGYTITKVHEIWHFRQRSTTLFSGYVNTFLKIKQEASGWPSWVGDSPIKRLQYIHDYHQHEGILLDSNNIEKNPGKRSLAKLMLNSPTSINWRHSLLQQNFINSSRITSAKFTASVRSTTK